MLVRLFVLSFLFFVSCSEVIEKQNPVRLEHGAVAKNQETIKLLFVGDLLLDRGVRERIEHAGIESLFTNSIDSVFSENDIVVANLECPATEIEEPINKKYIFRAEPGWLNTLTEHGITHLNLANNHSMDQGRDGLIDTDKNIRDNGMIPLGFGINVKEAFGLFFLLYT